MNDRDHHRPVQAHSDLSRPTVQHLNREVRRGLIAYLDGAARRGDMTWNTVAVAKALLKRSGSGGCFPNHATIATDVGLCERTVRDLLSRLKADGVLDWKRRAVLTRDPVLRHGVLRLQQTSNSYWFTLRHPRSLSMCRRGRGVVSGGNVCRRTGSHKNENKLMRRGRTVGIPTRMPQLTTEEQIVAMTLSEAEFRRRYRPYIEREGVGET